MEIDPDSSKDENRKSSILAMFTLTAVFSTLSLVGVVILLSAMPTKNSLDLTLNKAEEVKLTVSKVAKNMATEEHVAKAAQAVIQKIDHWGKVSSDKLDILEKRPTGSSLEEIKKLISEKPGLTVDEVRTAVATELVAAISQQEVVERQRIAAAEAKAEAESAARATAEAAAKAAEQQRLAMSATPATVPAPIVTPTPMSPALVSVPTGPATATGGQNGGPAVVRTSWRQLTVPANMESQEFDARKARSNGVRLEMKGKTLMTQHVHPKWGGNRSHVSEVFPAGYLVYDDARKVTFRSEAELIIWEKM